MMNITILSLFPEMFPGPLGHSLIGRAREKGIWHLSVLNPRDFAADTHQTVDDTPAGGGAGMVMKPDVLESAFLAIPKPGRRIYLSPRGRVLTQGLARELACESNITLLCGRYEGVDQRFLDAYEFEEISIGDYVLTGGELPAMVLIDTLVRLMTGVVGKEESLEHESHSHGLLEHPHYTRPNPWTDRLGRVHPIPDVLMSGHHANIEKWRLEKARQLTQERRPDLMLANQDKNP